MKVRCTQCNKESDSSEWTDTEFYCVDCGDNHDGLKCPTPDCDSIEGPGAIGWVEVRT